MTLSEDHPAHNLFYSVVDPESPLVRGPALTTLMFKVCLKDHETFEEATRLIGLFIAAAYELGTKRTEELEELLREPVVTHTDANWIAKRTALLSKGT